MADGVAGLFAWPARGCDGRGEPPCSGPFIGIRADRTLLMYGDLWVGQKIYFFNGDDRPHAFRCDPHPVYTGCDALDQVNLGILQYGYSEVFSKAGTFRFHDETDPNSPLLRGQLTVRCCIF